jgi:HEAT repeat protein
VIQVPQIMQLLRTRLFSLTAGCMLAALGGCAGGQWSQSAKSLAFWREEEGPPVRTRADQLKELRELAKEIPSASSPEQEQASLDLARAIRQETDPIVRAQMMRTLGACNTQNAARVAAAGARDTDSRVRIAACEALGLRGGSEQVRVLSEVLSSDTDIDVRLAAARALGEVRDPSAAQALAAALEDPNPALQARGMRSLERVTRQDFGNDVAAWQQYLRGDVTQPREQSLASRLRQLW